MLATYAASRHRQIVPCCMISSVSHDNVSRLVTDRSMCFATALDKAFENIDCMSAILRCQAKNCFYESTQRLIQPRRVLWARTVISAACAVFMLPSRKTNPAAKAAEMICFMVSPFAVVTRDGRVTD